MFINNTFLIVYFLFILSLFLKCIGKDNLALYTLLIAAFSIRIIAAHLDPFLHDWDERFHAIVARNMMYDPFKPVIRQQALFPYDYRIWCCNYVWLHKQPLFLWQMALSMKLFGVSEFTIRYPSILMGTIMVWLIYRIAWLLTNNRDTAYISALLLCVCSYQLMLISGFGMDHNDMAFGFYVLLSIWAYAEYIKAGTFKWVVLIGVFAGGAILNKWLTGLLVYAAWGANILMAIKERKAGREIKDILVSLLVCCLVFLPWQIYIHIRFPAEAAYETAYNSQHIYEIIEGHGGDALFYFNNLDMYFGNNLWILVVMGIVLASILSIENKIRNSIVICFLLIICFFSFIVKTKMPNYLFVIAPLGFLFIAIAATKLMDYLPAKLHLVSFIFISMWLSVVALDLQKMDLVYSKDDNGRKWKIHNTMIYKNLKKQLPPDVKYVFNAPAMEDVEVMFFNKDIDVRSYCPSEIDFKIIKDQKMPIAIFKDRPGYQVPNYVKEYPYLFIINQEVL